jgi:hypothetical protein
MAGGGGGLGCGLLLSDSSHMYTCYVDVNLGGALTKQLSADM